MDIFNTLDDFGLTKNKGRVYLAVLEIGSGSIFEIAKKVNLPRTTVHEIMQNLLSLGLVTYITKGRTRIYSAEPPAKLKNILQEKERGIEKIMPELLSLINTSGKRPAVKMYEGIEGIKTVFNDTLAVRDKHLRGILSMEDLYKVPGKKFMDAYVEKRINAGIRLRVIRSEAKEVEETWPTSERETRTMHYAPEDMIFPMTIYIYDKKVALIGTEKENFGMIIESEDFNLTLKNFFEVMWQVSRLGKKVD